MNIDQFRRSQCSNFSCVVLHTSQFLETLEVKLIELCSKQQFPNFSIVPRVLLLIYFPALSFKN